MLINNPYNSRNSRKNGYLYIHYHDSDAIKLIMAFNARRIAKNKQPYPVLVESEFEKNALEKAKRKVMIGKEILSKGSILNVSGTREIELARLHSLYQDGNNYWPMTYQEREALLSTRQYSKISMDFMDQSINIYLAFEQTKIKANKLSRLGVDDKLYILGHGKAGLPKIASGSDETSLIHIRELVKRLKESNLSKDIRDIRLNSCESAACFSISTFKNLNCPSLSYRLKKSLTQKKSAAMVLSEELFRAGYMDIIVTGYHGYGLTYYTLGQEPYRERVLGSVDGIRLTYLKEKKQASTVRETFKNGKPISITRM